MPVQQQAEKTEHEQKLWVAIKRHILNERKRKREELEAEVEEERQRKEREANKKKHAMTLGETKEQIQLLERKLEDLKKEKEQIFVQFKEVVNKEANLKRHQEREVPPETFSVQQKPIQPVFLPPRATVYQPAPSGNVVSHMGSLPMPTVAAVKRKQSPSPQSQIQPPPNSVLPPHSQAMPLGGYHRQPPPPEATLLAPRDDHRRSSDGRAVLWTSKPALLRHEPSLPAAAFVSADQLQYRPGTIPGYPPPHTSSGPHGKAPPQHVYSFPIAIRPSAYHMADMIPHPGQSPQSLHAHQVAAAQQSLKQQQQQQQSDVQIKSSMPASIYHIESRQSQMQQKPPPDRHVSYHTADVKHDDRPPELRQSHYDLAAASIRRDQLHMYPNPNLLQLSQQAQVVKTGSITQGYPTRSPSSNQPPHSHYPNIIHRY